RTARRRSTPVAKTTRGKASRDPRGTVRGPRDRHEPGVPAGVMAEALPQLVVLGQIVGYGEPQRLGPDEDMFGRADGRLADEGSHGDVDKGAVANDRKEERAAQLTVRVVAILVAKDQEVLLAIGDD